MIEISRKKATSRKHSYIVFSSFSFDCFNCRCCWCWWGVLKAQDTHREEGKNLSLFFSNAEHFLCYVHFTMDEHIYSHARKCTFASSNIAITTLHSLSLSNSIRTSPLLLLKKIHLWKSLLCVHTYLEKYSLKTLDSTMLCYVERRRRWNRKYYRNHMYVYTDGFACRHI